jgi:excisionase family DNA binding protein
MEIRFITFNSIIFNELMPWLPENQDEEKFRFLLHNLAPVLAKEYSLFFTGLPVACHHIRIKTGRKLVAEWALFTALTNQVPLLPVHSFVNTDDTNPKLVFYNFLLENTVSACYSFMVNLMAEDQSDTLRKHRIMNWMKAISDMIVNTQILRPEQQTDMIICRRLLAGLCALYAGIMNCFHEIIEPWILKICMADIKSILHKTSNDDEYTQSLYTSLAGYYFPASVVQAPQAGGQPQVAPAMLTPGTDKVLPVEYDLVKLIGEINSDVTGLKEVMSTAFKKQKESLTVPEDRLIGSAEVCAKLGISKPTLQSYREKKHLSFTRIGSRYLYSANEVDAMLKVNK